MLNSQLESYTHRQLSEYTHSQLNAIIQLKLITDRTADDVERWKTLRGKGWDGMTESERKEWLGEIVPSPAASKGMYTHNDLNRVEMAVESIAASLRKAGYDLGVSVKTNWTYRDTFGIEDVKRYYNNIAILRDCIVVYPDTPSAPKVSDNLTYRMANDIEKILEDVSDLSQKLMQSWCFVGEYCTGEV